jgi:hypothetical protein
MLLDLRDRLLQRLPGPSVQRRCRRASVNLRQQHRREKRVDARAQLSLDLRALAIGDCQAVGWARLDLPQDKCECALHLQVVLPAGLQERKGRDRRIGDVVAARLQPLSRPRGGRLASVLTPPAVGALHGRQPSGPFGDRSRHRRRRRRSLRFGRGALGLRPGCRAPHHRHRHDNGQPSHTVSFR